MRSKISKRLVNQAFSSLSNLEAVLFNKTESRDVRRIRQRVMEKFFVKMNANLFHQIIQSEKHHLFELVIAKAGENLGNAIKLGEMLFEIAAARKVEGDKEGDYFTSFLLWILLRPVAFTQHPSWQSAWIEQVTENLDREEVQFLFRTFFTLLLSKGISLQPIGFSEFGTSHQRHNRQSLNSVIKTETLFFWPVPDETVPALSKFYQETAAEIEETDKTIVEFSAEIETRKEQIEAKIEWLWKDLINVSRGIRPGGLDKVMVGIPVLNQFGLESFSFVGEGYFLLERVGIKFFGHWFGRPIIMEEIVNNGKLQNLPRHWPDGIRLAIRAMVVDSYHRLLVPSEMPEETISEESRKETDKKRTTPKRVYIAPLFRRLPDGWKASAKARKAAEQAFGFLPPGFTFVHGHERGVGEHLSTKPRFIYTEEDLRRF